MNATDTVKEALREYVGDGDGADEQVLREHNAAVVAGLDLPTILAEAMACTWSIGESGHPYAPNCHYRKHEREHGVCWDKPHELAAAIRAAVTSE
jgi:hypothetical protein